MFMHIERAWAEGGRGKKLEYDGPGTVSGRASTACWYNGMTWHQCQTPKAEAAHSTWDPADGDHLLS